MRLNSSSSLQRRLWALIPAAGAGLRFQADIDPAVGAKRKQFLEIHGTPVLLWTLWAIRDAAPALTVLAVPRSEVAAVEQLVASLESVDARSRSSEREGEPSSVAVVAGGETRQESVALALAACPCDDDDLVLIHDAARPAVSLQDVEAVIQAAQQDGVAGAVLGRAMTDTVKRLDGDILGETLDRRQLFRVETPQVFRAKILERVLTEALDRTLDISQVATDESTLVEQAGGRVLAVEATAENPKLTVAGDLERLTRLLPAS